MCKKLIYLVSFVCMLGLVSTAMADDLNPPWFAGVEGWGASVWEFNEEIVCNPTEECLGDRPTTYLYNPDMEEWEDQFGFRYYGEPPFDPDPGMPENYEEMCQFTWDAGTAPHTGTISVAGEEAIFVPVPVGEGENLMVYYQVTYQSERGFMPHMLELWIGYDRCFPAGDWERFWGSEELFEEAEVGPPPVELIDLGDGWYHATYIVDIRDLEDWMQEEMTHLNILWFTWDWCDPIPIDEVVIDLVRYTGDAPPEGPGTRPGPLVVKVSNEDPEDGEEHVPPDADANLCFQAPYQAPYKALCMWEFDPCKPEVGPPDPNLKGPFEYDVYFGTDPCVLLMTQLASEYTPADCNDVMCFDPCAGDFNPGTEYFWRVDINDLNSPGDSCFYEGPFFSFVTWGFAYDPVPPDGEEDVDTGTIQLKWTGDGFVGAAGTGYDVYFPEDTFVGYQDCGTADANKYTPAVTLGLGREYCWRVDEVNTVTIPGHVWCFSTSLCSTWETFEDYADDDAIVAVWVDGWTNDTGSMIYLGESSDNEPVHSGDQSMEYYFDNTVGGGILYPYSESTRTFSPVDWSPESDIAPGARALRIWFHDTDEDGAGAEQMYVKLYDGTTEGRVDFDPDTSVTEEEEEYWFWDEATEEDVFALWIGWSINLSDFDVELSTIASMTIGFDTEATDGLVFFDTFQLCGTRCIPAQAPWSWNEDCATDWDELEMIQENWLAKDEWEPVKEPCDANLVVEYLFDNDDLTDTAGDANGIPVNEPNIHDGLMTLDGDDWVIVPIDASLFQGDKSWTVIMDIVADVNGVMFGVAREPYGQVGEGGVDGEGYYYDPCLCLEDANYCNEGLPPYPYGGEEGTSGLVMFQGENGIVADRFWKGGTEVEDVPPGELYQVVLVYDAEEALCLIYVDETATGEPMEFDPNVPDPCEDTVTIGHTENSFYPDEEGIFNFIGDIDNFRIYDYALSYAEILGKLYPEDIEDGEHKFPLETDSNVDEQTINYDGKDRQIIDLRDFALFAEHWLEVVLWPPEE